MNADGRIDSPLLIVLPHKPSEGMEAWLLKVLFDEGKILRTDTRFVYMLDEPPKSKSGKATTAQMRSNWNRFSAQVQESKPRVVLAFGSEVLYYLTGVREGIHDTQGYILRNRHFRDIEWRVQEQVGFYKSGNKARGVVKGAPKFAFVLKNFPGLLGKDFDGVVIPSFTLEHIRTMAFAISPAFRITVQRAKRALNNGLIMSDQDFKYATTALEVMSTQWNDNAIAVDIETTGIDNDVIERVSISDGETTASFPWDTVALQLLNKVFSRPYSTFVLHNSGFDLPRLKEHGVNITQDVMDHQIFDTMFAAVIIQPDLLKGLGAVAPIYLDLEPWKWRSLSQADPVYYSAKDAFVTARIAKQEIQVLKNMGLWNLTMGLKGHPGPGVMATIPVLTDLHRKGIKTNREYANWWVKKLERRLFRLEKLWSRMFGGISPHSTRQVQQLLYGEWKLPVQRTKKDSTTSDELSLIKLKYYISGDYAQSFDMGPWREDKRCVPRTFDLLLRIRDISKTISTYVQKVSSAQETRVYPSYLPESKDNESGPANSMRSKGNTSTGRLATFNPNIGNQPKKVRKLYIPDNDDMCFIQGDWKAAELCVFAWTSGDERLKADLKRDLHSENAKRFGITRDVAKNVIYASQYLAGASKVNEMIMGQAHLYVAVDECRRIMDGLNEYYWGVAALKNHLAEMCNQKKYIQNPFGRVRLFHSGEAPAAVDFWAQSIVAECLWCILKEVADFAHSLGGRLTTTVYDSILIQVPKEKVHAAVLGLRKIMEKTFDIVAKGFFIPTEFEVGDPGASWGELKKYVTEE